LKVVRSRRRIKSKISLPSARTAAHCRSSCMRSGEHTVSDCYHSDTRSPLSTGIASRRTPTGHCWRPMKTFSAPM
jgi:hypothetical protein